MKRWIQSLVALCTAGLVAACGGGGGAGDTGPVVSSQDLAGALASNGKTDTMAGAAASAGLNGTLGASQSVTLLMPSDEAMAPFAEELAELSKPENREALALYVKAHIIEGKVLADALAQAGVPASKGQDAAAAPLAATGITSSTATGSTGDTVLAVKNLLGGEIEIRISGANITINGASFVTRDIVAGNGVLHVFNAPIFRPSVFGVVRELRQTATLEAAIRAAGLTDTLRGKGPFTLFAPTNDAFDKLLRELNFTASQLLANKPLLTQVLTYHVLGSQVLARQIENGATPATVQGQAITLGAGRDGFGQRTIGITDARGRQANVTFTNLRASNGVVHLIDRVILPTDKDIVDIAAGNADFSILVAAVQAAGLVDTLKGLGPFTVFAPTNAAFASLLSELNVTAEQLLANKPLLTKVLTYHVLASRSLAASLTDGLARSTVQGESITFRRQGDTLSIVDARGRVSKVAIANVQASNGVVHAIDKVILPNDLGTPPPAPSPKNIVETAIANPQFSTLVAAVQAAGLVDTLSGPGPFTVFAPTNAAFDALLAELGLTAPQLLANKPLLTQVLTYHVLASRSLAESLTDGLARTTVLGQPIQFERGAHGLRIVDARGRVSNVVAADVIASNGVVHAIDKVILPTDQNLVQLAQSVPDLSILVEAVVAANLQGALSGTGPFTVFAPTNAAFAALLHELHLTKAALLADKALLTKVLTYHVVPAQVLSSDIPFGQPVTSLQGQTFVIGQDLKITDQKGRKSQIVATDVAASNGVVHLIDKVILPK
jgi:transforming growth factor-beta-induced protein